VDDIEAMASPSERGRGFAILGQDGRVQLVRGLHAARVTEEYLRLARRQRQVVVYHSRLPTMGGVTVSNTQPFAAAGRVFGHNGTLPEPVVAILRVVVARTKKDASDSALLWEVLRALPWDEAIRLLRSLPGRYVLADHRAGRVALIGGWAQTRPDTWGRGTSSWVILNLRGKVLEEVSAPVPWWRQRFSSADGLASTLVWPSPKSIV
jgi:glutamine phosphoribosylpyrophosphate amidotransferase